MINQNQCLNPDCSSHKAKNFQYMKMGKVFIRTRRAFVQRFRCKACGKTFQSSSFRKTASYENKNNKLKKQIQHLHCGGMTSRSISKFLKISRNTLSAKIKELAIESKHKYENFDKFYYLDHYHHTNLFKLKEFKANKKSPLLVFDEMETHLVSPVMPLSVGIAYDFYNDKIIAIKACGFTPRNVIPPLNKLGKDFKKEYQRIYNFDFVDHRKEMSSEVFEIMRLYSDKTTAKSRTIITDGKTNYPVDIKNSFNDIEYEHIIFKTKGVSVVDDSATPDMLDSSMQLKPTDELRNKDYFKLIGKSKMYKQHHISAFAKFNKICSLLRLNLAVLHRKSFCTIKSMESFQDSLLAFQDWYNSRKLTKEEVWARNVREDDRKIRKGF